MTTQFVLGVYALGFVLGFIIGVASFGLWGALLCQSRCGDGATGHFGLNGCTCRTYSESAP